MALRTRATRHPYGLPAAETLPALTAFGGSRGKPEMLLVRATEVADLIDELTAAGQDMVALASRLDLAYSNDRLDLIPAVIDRLRHLGEQYRDCTLPRGIPA